MKNEIKYIVILAIIAFSLPFLFSYNLQTGKTTIIKTSFLIGNKPGFDLNPNELTFGRIIPNSSASRAITITNNFNEPKKISIKSSGEISKYIIASKNNFILNPNEAKNITFTVYSTNLEEFKEYNGKIIIISE